MSDWFCTLRRLTPTRPGPSSTSSHLFHPRTFRVVVLDPVPGVSVHPCRRRFGLETPKGLWCSRGGEERNRVRSDRDRSLYFSDVFEGLVSVRIVSGNRFHEPLHLRGRCVGTYVVWAGSFCVSSASPHPEGDRSGVEGGVGERRRDVYVLYPSGRGRGGRDCGPRIKRKFSVSLKLPGVPRERHLR